jgi:hypothetical protein
MGSHRFYHDQLDARGVHFALILDMVSHDVSIPLGSVDLPVPLSYNHCWHSQGNQDRCHIK